MISPNLKNIKMKLIVIINEHALIVVDGVIYLNFVLKIIAFLAILIKLITSKGRRIIMIMVAMIAMIAMIAIIATIAMIAIIEMIAMIAMSAMIGRLKSSAEHHFQHENSLLHQINSSPLPQTGDRRSMLKAMVDASIPDHLISHRRSLSRLNGIIRNLQSAPGSVEHGVSPQLRA